MEMRITDGDTERKNMDETGTYKLEIRGTCEMAPHDSSMKNST